jgi:hypothetical protein
MMPELPVFGDWRCRGVEPDADSQAIELRTKVDGFWR